MCHKKYSSASWRKQTSVTFILAVWNKKPKVWSGYININTMCYYMNTITNKTVSFALKELIFYLLYRTHHLLAGTF